MFQNLSDAQLLQQVEEARKWERFAGFCGREEEDRCTRFNTELEIEFNRRGYLYPRTRADLQPAHCKPMVLEAA